MSSGDHRISPAQFGTQQWRRSPAAELVPLAFFDDMPSINEGAESAGDVDRDTWSHRIKDEYRDRIPHLENFEELKTDMEDRGLDEPIRIGYDPPGTRETQRLNEGNHRLAAARELGWDAIPAIVQHSGRENRPSHSGVPNWSGPQ